MLGDWWWTAIESGGSGACVEVRYAGVTVEVRDSKDREGPILEFDPRTWRTFVNGLNEGQLKP